MITNKESNNFITLIGKIQEMTNFINQYNSIGYGECKVIETKEHFIFEFYNAGFSENEELDRVIIKQISYTHYNLIYENHPIMIFKINKRVVRNDFKKITLLKKQNHPIFDPFRMTQHYYLKKEYKFKIELR